MWTQLCLILAVLHPTFTHVTAILCGQAVRSPQKCAEKKLKRSTWMQPHSMQFASSAELSRDTCRKKSQRVALALPIHTCMQRHYVTVLHYMSVPTLKIHHFSMRLCVLSCTAVQQKYSVPFQHSWLYTLGGFGISHNVQLFEKFLGAPLLWSHELHFSFSN